MFVFLGFVGFVRGYLRFCVSVERVARFCVCLRCVVWHFVYRLENVYIQLCAYVRIRVCERAHVWVYEVQLIIINLKKSISSKVWDTYKRNRKKKKKHRKFLNTGTRVSTCRRTQPPLTQKTKISRDAITSTLNAVSVTFEELEAAVRDNDVY